MSSPRLRLRQKQSYTTFAELWACQVSPTQSTVLTWIDIFAKVESEKLPITARVML
jgi:hypothetical protein